MHKASLTTIYFCTCACACIFLSITSCQQPASIDLPRDYPIKPQPFYKVTIDDNFWNSRFQTQSEVLLPIALERTKPAVENLARTASFLQNKKDSLPFPHRYISSDLYKVLEGAAYLLMTEENTQLERRIDSIIDIIGEAQKEDGYLYVAHITGVSKNHDHWGGGGMGDKPYSFVLHSHELYNMGHMYEAAIAYYQATGKSKWLKIAEKNAQHINEVFFEGHPDYNDGEPVMQAPGHQEIELALVKLYRTTGKPLYLDMAKKFLEIRGVTYKPDGEQYLSPTYAQQHLPVSEQKEAVGHAVRAAYMYSAMADVEALSSERKYEQALQAIWRNLVDSKMHITGGLGASHGIEGFGKNYDLPNPEAYNETCAAVANVLFNYRLFLLHGASQYVDVVEIALYNNVLAGVSLDGDKFFYVNPLESDGEFPFNHGSTGRSPWFNTACCPTNLARLIPQIPGMMYAYTEEDIYFNLFASSRTAIPLENQEIRIEQETSYPFDGQVKIKLHIDKVTVFRIHLRLPSWAISQFVPGMLYHYARPEFQPWSVKINGQVVDCERENGYAVLDRLWIPGDEIILELPMPVRFNTCTDSVEVNRNKMAISRGPLLYCAEEVDNHARFMDFRISENIPRSEILTREFESAPLKDITRIEMQAFAGQGIQDKKENLTLIPYYAWNNRGTGKMKIWFNRKLIN